MLISISEIVTFIMFIDYLVESIPVFDQGPSYSKTWAFEVWLRAITDNPTTWKHR